jgi:hypothetical protein
MMKANTQAKPHNTPRANNLHHIHRDRGYRFADHDEDLIFIANLISKSGKSAAEIARDVAKLSYGVYIPSPSTLDNWLNGKTKKPQNFTLTWVAAALGFERKWRKI